MEYPKQRVRASPNLPSVLHIYICMYASSHSHTIPDRSPLENRKVLLQLSTLSLTQFLIVYSLKNLKLTAQLSENILIEEEKDPNLMEPSSPSWLSDLMEPSSPRPLTPY